MTLRQIVYGKFHAVRVLLQFRKYLRNWKDVWSAYRNRKPLPPLELRSGYTLHHGAGDEPVGLLQEVIVLGAYRKHLREPLRGAVVDLGANIGTSTLDLLSHFPSIRVFAWEPNPETFARLERNIVSNGLSDRVTIHRAAAARGAGELTFSVGVPSVFATAYGGNLPVMPEIGLRPAEARSVTVRSEGLDEVIAATGADRIALLKVDAEGAEADIFEGASQEALRKIRQVAIEYHDHLVPDSLARSRGALERAGFTCTAEPYNATQGMLYGWR